MKKINLFLLLMALSSYTFSKPVFHLVKSDTITIKFGDNTKMTLIFPDEERENLTNIDLNAILKEINEDINKSGRDSLHIEIEKEVDTKQKNDSIDQSEDKLSEKQILKKEGFKKKNHRTETSLNFELGLNNYLLNGQFPDALNETYSLSPFNSVYLAIPSNFKTHIAKSLFINWGGSINWYNFVFDNANTRIRKGESEVEFYEANPDLSARKSKFVVSYINAHMMFLFDFDKNKSSSSSFDLEERFKRKGFRIGIGAYGGYKLGSHSNFKYTVDKTKGKEKERHDFFLNNWRYGVRVQFGYRALDLFVNYDLNPLFIADRGPSLNTMSFGIIF